MSPQRLARLRRAGVRPGRRLLWALGGWAILAVAASAEPRLLAVWIGGGLLLALLAGATYPRARRRPALEAEREIPGALPLGVWSEVTLRLRNPGSEDLDLEVFDGVPPELEAEGLPRRLTVPAGGWGEIPYRVRPTRRGPLRFLPIEVLVHRPADLWRPKIELEPEEAGDEVRVLPNFQAVARFALLALSDQLSQIGVRSGQRRGEGLEFQELREYREGDSLRRIDWKATARRQQLISRQYQEEKAQQVVCLVDCGRRMRARDGELTHFDQVLNSLLLLAYIALRQGDSFGFLTFSGERRWLPPVRGGSALAAILKTTYDLDTSLEPSDYLQAATELMARQRRRALVIVMTNLRDEDSDEILPALRLLRSRHLVLLASLREAALDETQETPLETLDQAVTVAALHRYLESRTRLLDKARIGGVLALDTLPAQLPLRLVNRYLDIKRSGAL